MLYHSAAELVTDWPAIFAREGFRIVESRDIIAQTLPTWEHVRAVYRLRNGEVVRRYGRRLADRTVAHLERIGQILAEHGTFPALAAQKPMSGRQFHLTAVAARTGMVSLLGLEAFDRPF